MLLPLLVAALMVGAVSLMLSPHRAVAQTAISVNIQNFAFNPSSMTVSIGGTVTWTNNDNVAHTVTASDGSFNSGNIAPGHSFSHTFTTSGTVNYECTIHTYMKGTIVVISGTSTSSATATSSSSSSSGGIPEFPFETVAVVATMVAVLGSYLAIRRTRRR